ncbi:MAG: FixH family protein [archaeon GB-1867-005]|nr:FixH family protein [Candidatus Culexmicrobium cathedralense]
MQYKLTLYGPEVAYVNEPVVFHGELRKLTKNWEPVEGAKIYLLINDEIVADTETLREGYYEFTWTFKEPGRYKVQTSTTAKPPAKIPWGIIAAGAALAGLSLIVLARARKR